MITPYLGEIQMMACTNVPHGWLVCDGTLLAINQNQALFSLLGTTYGGNGVQNFALPDLRGCVPVMFGDGLTLGQRVGGESATITLSQLPSHVHAVSGLSLSCANSSATLRSPVNNVPAVEARGVTTVYSSNANAAMSPQAISGFGPVLAGAGGGQPHENRPPFLALKFLIATQGFFPNQQPPFESSREPIVGEISMFAGNFAPSGWAFCQGQLLPLSQNTALFSLLGTFYGGDGKSTFALPNLSGKTPMLMGTGPAGIEYFQGEEGGVDSVTLLTTEMPVHPHAVASGSATPSLRCFSGAGNASTPVGNVPAAEAFGATALYGPAADGTLMSHSVGTQVSGSSFPHNNRPPSLTMNFIIAMQGQFPQRQ